MDGIFIGFGVAQSLCLFALLWSLNAMRRSSKRQADAAAEFAERLRASAEMTRALRDRVRALRAGCVVGDRGLREVEEPPVYPSVPRLSPDGLRCVCDQCGREWDMGADPGCAECAAAWERV